MVDTDPRQRAPGRLMDGRGGKGGILGARAGQLMTEGEGFFPDKGRYV